MSEIKSQIIDVLKEYAEDTTVYLGKCSRGCCNEYENQKLIPKEDYGDIADDIMSMLRDMNADDIINDVLEWEDSNG